jgi:AAA domain
VLVVTFEDLVAETVVPRLIAAGADLSRVRTIEVEHDGDRDLVSLPDDVAGIEEAAVEHGVRLLIVDPLMAALTGGTDSHRDSQVRRVLAPLAKLAERTDLGAGSAPTGEAPQPRQIRGLGTSAHSESDNSTPIELS